MRAVAATEAAKTGTIYIVFCASVQYAGHLFCSILYTSPGKTFTNQPISGVPEICIGILKTPDMVIMIIATFIVLLLIGTYIAMQGKKKTRDD